MNYKITDQKSRSSIRINEDAAGEDIKSDIFEALLMGKTLEFEKQTSRGTFAAKYPSGKDKLLMGQLRAFKRSGLPASAFDAIAHTNTMVWTELDVLIIDGPEWYRNLKAGNKNWSWEDYPDEEFIGELHLWVDSFCDEIQARIRESRSGKASQDSNISEPATAMGYGAFQGLANRSPNQGVG